MMKKNLFSSLISFFTNDTKVKVNDLKIYKNLECNTLHVFKNAKSSTKFQELWLSFFSNKTNQIYLLQDSVLIIKPIKEKQKSLDSIYNINEMFKTTKYFKYFNNRMSSYYEQVYNNICAEKLLQGIPKEFYIDRDQQEYLFRNPLYFTKFKTPECRYTLDKTLIDNTESILYFKQYLMSTIHKNPLCFSPNWNNMDYSYKELRSYFYFYKNKLKSKEVSNDDLLFFNQFLKYENTQITNHENKTIMSLNDIEKNCDVISSNWKPKEEQILNSHFDFEILNQNFSFSNNIIFQDDDTVNRVTYPMISRCELLGKEYEHTGNNNLINFELNRVTYNEYSKELFMKYGCTDFIGYRERINYILTNPLTDSLTYNQVFIDLNKLDYLMSKEFCYPTELLYPKLDLSLFQKCNPIPSMNPEDSLKFIVDLYKLKYNINLDLLYTKNNLHFYGITEEETFKLFFIYLKSDIRRFNDYSILFKKSYFEEYILNECFFFNKSIHEYIHESSVDLVEIESEILDLGMSVEEFLNTIFIDDRSFSDFMHFFSNLFL